MKMKAANIGKWLTIGIFAQAAVVALAAPPVHLDRKGDKWAASTLRRMSPEEKVGQMIMVWARVEFMNTQSPDYLQLREEMRKYHIGGFGVTTASDGGVLLKNPPLEAVYLTNELQRDSKYPLLFAADFERGPSMRLVETTAFPAAMAFGAAGDKGLVREFGRISALESRAIGVHWNWFPVADVNSNPANPIINTRSFGEDPQAVGDLVAAYIEGAHSAGLLTTIKHFPGHGDTDTDSHIGLARVGADNDRLNHLELVPFRIGIAAGVDSVMVGHITVPAIEPDPNLPASISPRVITGLLKEQLHFHGLVVTDALDMGALMHVFKGTDADISAAQAVAAVLAGNDMVIIPADLDGAYNGLLQAVQQGKITQARIDESVLKILRMKASLGLERNRFVDPRDAERDVAMPESLALAQEVADRAVTLVEDDNKLVPLNRNQPAADRSSPHGSGMVAIVFADSPRGSEGDRAFVAELRQRASHSTVFYVDSGNAGSIAESVLAAVKKAGTVIVLAESAPNPRRTTQGHEGGSAAMDVGPAQLLASVVRAAASNTIVAAFGNPYTGAGVQGIHTYLCTFSNTIPSAVSLARALFGETPIHGRLPVTIPGMAARGAGLDRDAVMGSAVAAH